MQRGLFRFACLYFLLYALPFPFVQLWQLVTQVLDTCGADLSGPSWAWTAAAWEGFSAYGSGWQAATTWLGANVFHVEVVHQPTGSGDTMHDWLKLAASTGAALVLTALWSLLSRATHYRRLGRWLHLGTRWYLGFTLLGYGVIKFYAGQFSYPGLGRLMNPIGDTSPMGLVWTFMGFSKPYEVFAGLGETIGGLLLFWRRTSVLGCLVTIAVMTNVAALNWMFDVPVKLFSTNLLLFALALLAPDCRRLWNVLIANRPAPAQDLALTRVGWLRAALIGFGTLWVGFQLYGAHGGNMARLAQQQERPALYGVWEVDKMLRGGVEVAGDDVTRWQLLAIDTHKRAWIRTITSSTTWLSFTEDATASSASVGRLSGTTPPADPVTWTFERGERTVQSQDPAPRTMADFGRQVDLTRPSLVVRGTWDGADLEVHLLRKLFRLERGFHFVQEMPYNR